MTSWATHRPTSPGWHLNAWHWHSPCEHQRWCVPWDWKKDLWLGKFEMPHIHNRRCSGEHYGQPARFCDVLNLHEPKNIPSDRGPDKLWQNPIPCKSAARTFLRQVWLHRFDMTNLCPQQNLRQIPRQRPLRFCSWLPTKGSRILAET